MAAMRKPECFTCGRELVSMGPASQGRMLLKCGGCYREYIALAEAVAEAVAEPDLLPCGCPNEPIVMIQHVRGCRGDGAE